MKIRTHQEANATLESIALTDIILNIFIFFFMSFSLLYTFNPQRESRIEVQLPQADSRLPLDERAVIQITLDRRGQAWLDGGRVQPAQIRERLEQALAADPRRQVVVRADKNVVFDRVVGVLDVARGAGVQQLGLAIEGEAPRAVR